MKGSIIFPFVRSLVLSMGMLRDEKGMILVDMMNAERLLNFITEVLVGK